MPDNGENIGDLERVEVERRQAQTEMIQAQTKEILTRMSSNIELANYRRALARKANAEAAILEAKVGGKQDA